MKAFLAAALLVAALLAGCSANDTTETTGPPTQTTGPSDQRYDLPADPNPEGAGHVHGDPAQHKFLWNYNFTARDPLLQNQANVAGVHALDVQAGYLFGAVYGSHAASVDGGLVIWDLSDPAHPQQTGRWIIPGSVGGDRSMEATPDGRFVVIATEPVDCAGHVNPLGVVGAYLLDTQDKTLPVVADAMTLNGVTLGNVLGGQGPGQPEQGQHSVAVHRIGGVDYALIFGKVYQIELSEQGAHLVHVSTIPTGHDIYVRDTPWNTTWALSANGGGGLTIWDLTDPTAPFQLATWDVPDREALANKGVEYYIHTADVSFQPDGQVLIVVTSEDFAEHVSPFWVVDGNPLRGVTTASSPIELDNTLGSWSNPGDHNALAGLTFSLHNPRFHDGGILTLSSYHGGMWQLDLRHPSFWADPAPIAYAAYSDGEPPQVSDPVEGAVQKNLCGLEIAVDTPSYWDVEVGPGGHLYLADGMMGLYTFAPTKDHPVYGAPGDYPGTAGL
ncbi:MAG: hypothetical protein QOD77_641 [Thermoplasmata archaeon]|nr:hypothetical protein [Thermoplasmata archaeon]